MLDALQVVVIAVLIAVGIASFLILYKEFAPNLISDERTELDRPSFLMFAIPIVLIIPIMLVCSIGSLWLVMIGWDGFQRTLLISAGSGLLMGVILAVFSYFVSIVGRRQEQKIEEEMKKIEKTKRPLPMKYAAKAVLAITVLVLGTMGFDLLVSNFSLYKPEWQEMLLFEALFWGVLGVAPLVPTMRYIPVSSRDPAVKWWVISLITAAAILVFLSLLLPYLY